MAPFGCGTPPVTAPPSRILTAVQPPGGTWGRPAMAIDAGFAGDSDSYGAESPCVVKTPGGYLMVYGGFDGEVGRLHMATSEELPSLGRSGDHHCSAAPRTRAGPTIPVC
jgi:hypothetical protein